MRVAIVGTAIGLTCEGATPLTSPNCTNDSFEPNDVQAEARPIGSLSGDVGAEALVRSGVICPGGEDWFTLRLTEDASSPVSIEDLTARFELATAAGGDALDFCVLVPTRPASCASGTAIDVVISDVLGADNTTDVAISVRGRAASDESTYTLTVRGNTG